MKKIFLLLTFIPTIILGASDVYKSKLTNYPEEIINQILSYSGFGTKQALIGDDLLNLKYLKYLTRPETSTSDKWEYFRNSIVKKKIDDKSIQHLLMSNDGKSFVQISTDNIMTIRDIDPKFIINSTDINFDLGRKLNTINILDLIDQPIQTISKVENTGIDNVIMLEIDNVSERIILFIDINRVVNEEPNHFTPIITNQNYHDFKLSPNKKFALGIGTTSIALWDTFSGKILWETQLNTSKSKFVINNNFVISATNDIKLFDILTGKFNEEESNKLNQKINYTDITYEIYGDYILCRSKNNIKVLNSKSLYVLDLETPENSYVYFKKVDKNNNTALIQYHTSTLPTTEEFAVISLKTGKIIKYLKNINNLKIDKIEFSDDGSLLLNFNPPSLDLIDLDNMQLIKNVDIRAFCDISGKKIIKVYISDNGNTILINKPEEYFVVTINNAVNRMRMKSRNR